MLSRAATGYKNGYNFFSLFEDSHQKCFLASDRLIDPLTFSIVGQAHTAQA
jgi:hypothetical protein